MKMKFTIVTCTYNAAPTLQRTLDSVGGQSWEAVEHIIMDGCSTDATVAMASKYKTADDATDNGHSVVVISEPDSGLYDAMNKALDRATGDYVVFINSGDAFHSSSTLAEVAACVKPGEPLPAVLYGDTNLVDATGTFVAPRRLAPPERLTWRSFRKGMLVCHQAFFARTDIARSEHYDLRYRFSADVDWCIRVMKRAENEGLPLRRVRSVTADYLAEGMTTANHHASLGERFDVMRRHYGLLSTLVMHLWFVVRSVLRR